MFLITTFLIKLLSFIPNMVLLSLQGEYQQNLCQKGAPSCQPCPVRLPSCIGLQDGPNPHPSQLWNAQFITCYKNRTVQIDKCADGEYFHPRERTCKKDVKTGTCISMLLYCLRCLVHLNDFLGWFCFVSVIKSIYLILQSNGFINSCRK